MNIHLVGRSGLPFAIALALAAAASGSRATSSRWSSMGVPVDLGRDEASLDLLPALIAETPAGLYADPATTGGTGASDRFLWVSGAGAHRMLVGLTDPDGIRLGAAGWKTAGIVWGVQGWLGASTTNADAYNSDPPGLSIRNDQRHDSYGGGLGFRAGDPGAAHVDGGLSVMSIRDRITLERMVAGVDTMLARTKPDPRASWRAFALFSIPAAHGWIRSAFQASQLDDEAPLTRWRGMPSPPELAHGTTETSVQADVGWMGAVRRIDLFACGLFVRDVRTRGTELDNVPVEIVHYNDRTVEAGLYAGAEVRPRPWLYLRAGASRSYSDVQGNQTYWPYRSNGYVPDYELSFAKGGFSNATGFAGIGVKLGRLRVDLDLDVHGLLMNAFRGVSITLPFGPSASD